MEETSQTMIAKDVVIDVTADNDGKGGIAWGLEIKTPGHGKNGELNMPKGSSYVLKFSLLSKLDLRFDAGAPIFVRDGGAGPCPDKISTDQIMVDSCNATSLVIVDWNYGEPSELYYQLNFVSKNGKVRTDYDPKIVNGGGGTFPSG